MFNSCPHVILPANQGSVEACGFYTFSSGYFKMAKKKSSFSKYNIIIFCIEKIQIVCFCFVDRNSTISLFHLVVFPARGGVCSLAYSGRHTLGIMVAENG